MSTLSADGAPLVLVVDDCPDNREMIAMYLGASGLRVEEAATAHEALARASEIQPHVVLMDLALPGLDGCEATRRLKRDTRTAHILVVALTGHADANNARIAREAGCDAFLVKPCDPAAVLGEIRNLLGRR